SCFLFMDPKVASRLCCGAQHIPSHRPVLLPPPLLVGPCNPVQPKAGKLAGRRRGTALDPLDWQKYSEESCHASIPTLRWSALVCSPRPPVHPASYALPLVQGLGALAGNLLATNPCQDQPQFSYFNSNSRTRAEG